MFDGPRVNLPPVVFSSFRYNRRPAVNLNSESTCNFPLIPVLSWGQSQPIMTVNPMSEVNVKLVFNFGALDTVRCTSPIRTRACGWRRVNPMCLPVLYNNRHFPGSNSSQFCMFRITSEVQQTTQSRANEKSKNYC